VHKLPDASVVVNIFLASSNEAWIVVHIQLIRAGNGSVLALTEHSANILSAEETISALFSDLPVSSGRVASVHTARIIARRFNLFVLTCTINTNRIVTFVRRIACFGKILLGQFNLAVVANLLGALGFNQSGVHIHTLGAGARNIAGECSTFS